MKIQCSTLRVEVDTFMKAYDKKIAGEETKAKKEGVPDEEGWVKVTHQGYRLVLEREKRRYARKELLKFYAWQHRETSRDVRGGQAED
ncbi:Ribosomal RNA-processing protein 7-like A [Cricetulus griseus]|uniref:Putative ribosomal RNA-processing protein 7 n=1 Tax=Cricetulus griseus TaxID=10029 RepID=G3HWU7_CRIGR|nr:Ribosomal RNA-processing protein 7-like A [Cricetulus griseus]ERE65374.1 putative ribosomal RNA-processing protein 7 [Cricetulus griseus]